MPHMGGNPFLGIPSHGILHWVNSHRMTQNLVQVIWWEESSTLLCIRRSSLTFSKVRIFVLCWHIRGP
jgi:hypothetical protein